MAAVATMKRFAVNVKLNAGTNSNGDVKTKTVGMGNLNYTTATPEKILTIVDLMAPCLENEVYTVEQTEVKTLSNVDD